jgi:uncharacterized protein (TIGR02217 family)
MSYLPAPFPDDIAPQPSGGPGWSTDIVMTLSGDEQRNQNWLESRHTYELSHGIRTAAAFKAVGAHFRMARGKLHTFRFTDWADFECERADGGLVEITTTTFQLAKLYGAEMGFTESRRITRPRTGTVQVWKAGTLLTGGTDYTVDVETGIVTFATAPGAATLEAAFDFDVHCRYDTDQLKAVLIRLADSDESLLSWDSVPVVEVHE